MSDQRQPGGQESPSSPVSSASTSIAVGSTPEEDLYALAGHARRSPSTAPTSSSASHYGGGSGGPSSTAATGMPGSFISSASNPSEAAAHAAHAAFMFDSNMSNYPASMTSSIRQHVYEGGLRYHAFRDGKYAFPNDDVEQNRDDMKHTMTIMLCRGKHFYAPVEEKLREGGKCLDLGTGTGIWVIEVGEAYPNATITGLDLSPIQPNYVPENVHFFVDDFEEEWLDPESTFDFIHIRHTIHSIRDRATLLSRAYRHLKPGGYLEIQELHYSPQCDDSSVTPSVPYAFRDFMGFLDQGLRALGSELNAILRVPEEMADAGFEDVQVVHHKCPIGVWPRDKRMRLCGLFLRTAIMDGLRGLSKRPFGTGLGWTQLQIEMFLVDVRKSVMDTQYHTYFPLHIVHGRKPL
ncbi:S-adenosyl-L-methionine-dependent methyltransferase [Coniochaeta sp. 2T2.1]|nr:S-adenosyl-L-methionine-dependent methyltransferase [Coniochaeta sp. 2T2.1]